MAKFNMNAIGVGNGMLNKISQDLKDGFEIHYIPIEQIEENKLNNYSIDGIEELVDSIKAVGLKQSLDVMKAGENKYIILTGHRRFKALQTLSHEDEKFRLVPCTITDPDQVKMPISEKSKEKYLIHITNATQRDMTEADKYNQYTDLVAIYTEAKNNGFILSDKMRKLIAEDMKVSPAQVGKMDYIRNNGTEELQNRIKENEISIAAANEIAHHDKEAQATLKPKKERIIDNLDQDTYSLTLEIINPLTKKYATFTKEFNQASSAGRIIEKKKYAKILEAKEKIEKEIEKLNKIIKED